MHAGEYEPTALNYIFCSFVIKYIYTDRIYMLIILVSYTALEKLLCDL